MKELKFENEQLDSFKYSEKLAELQNFSALFSSAIKMLKENGLPTTEDFIKGHMLSEMALRLYLNSLAKKEIDDKGGYLVEDKEHDKIIKKYRIMFDGIKGLVPTFAKTFTKGFVRIVADKEGNLTVDKNYIKDVAHLYATYFIDGEQLAKYHDMCQQMFEQRKAIREFEAKHCIPQSFGLGELIQFAGYFGDNQVLKGERIDNLFGTSGLDTQDHWLQMFGTYFRTNGTDNKDSKSNQDNKGDKK